jgi:hypothetical protein
MWAIGEDMAEMCVAELAAYGSAQHTEAGVALFHDVFFGDGRPEAWPASAGLELRVRAEQRSIAADASIEAALVLIP